MTDTTSNLSQETVQLILTGMLFMTWMFIVVMGWADEIIPVPLQLILVGLLGIMVCWNIIIYSRSPKMSRDSWRDSD